MDYVGRGHENMDGWDGRGDPKRQGWKVWEGPCVLAEERACYVVGGTVM